MDTTDIFTPPSPAGDFAVPPTLPSFLRAADAFLDSTMDPEEFLHYCDLALASVDDPEYEYQVYKYRFLAFLNLERYYQAFAESFVFLHRFRDIALHHQMQCSVNLKRNNHHKALEHITKLIDFSLENGLDAEEYREEKTELVRYINNIVQVNAEDLCRQVGLDPQSARFRYANTSFLVYGDAMVVVHPDNHVPYLVFRTGHETIKHIYCQTPQSESPFIRHLDEESSVIVFGHLLNADKEKIVMYPCNLID